MHSRVYKLFVFNPLFRYELEWKLSHDLLLLVQKMVSGWLERNPHMFLNWIW